MEMVANAAAAQEMSPQEFADSVLGGRIPPGPGRPGRRGGPDHRVRGFGGLRIHQRQPAVRRRRLGGQDLISREQEQRNAPACTRD